MPRKKDDFSIIDLDERTSRPEDYGNYRDEYEFNYEETKKTRNRSKDKVLKTILAIICFYLAFLIVGVSVTNFYTTEENKKQVIFVNFDYIKDKKDYNLYKKQILYIRDTITDIYVIRNAAANGQITSAQAINKFTAILKPFDDKINKVDVLDVQKDNIALKTQIYSILKGNLALCLQQYINGYTQNNEELIADGDAYFTDSCNDYDNIMTTFTQSANELHLNDDEFLVWDFEKEIEEKNKEEGYVSGS